MGLFSKKTNFLALMALALVMLMSTISTGHAQPASPEALLGKKVTRLQVKATKNKGMIELDAAAFEDVMAMPRNYSMVVLFTAISPEYNCAPCQNFDPEYRLVASGWSKLTDKTQLFFGSLDFKTGQAIFQKFGMNSAPSVIFFPPSGAPSSQPAMDRYDFTKSGFQAETFASWLNSRAGTAIPVKRPFDFLGAAISGLTVIGLAYSAFMMYTKAGKIFGSRNFWSTLSLFTIFIMISGHMWNQIRRPAYTTPSHDGRPGFIAQGFQNQLGLETQIVAVVYALLCASVIGLFAVVPKIENPTTQRIAVWVSMGMFTFVFSVLIQLFKVKNPAYPFQLLFR